MVSTPGTDEVGCLFRVLHSRRKWSLSVYRLALANEGKDFLLVLQERRFLMSSFVFVSLRRSPASGTLISRPWSSYKTSFEIFTVVKGVY